MNGKQPRIITIANALSNINAGTQICELRMFDFCINFFCFIDTNVCYIHILIISTILNCQFVSDG